MTSIETMSKNEAIRALKAGRGVNSMLRAIEVLAKSGDTDALQSIYEFAKSEEGANSAQVEPYISAGYHIARLGNVDSDAQVLDLIHTASLPTQSGIFKGLTERIIEGKSKADDLYIEAYKVANEDMKLQLIESCHKLDPRVTTPILKDALLSSKDLLSDSVLEVICERALIRSSELQVHLRDIAKGSIETKTHVRVACIEALGQLSKLDDVAAILQDLRDNENGEISAAASRALLPNH